MKAINNRQASHTPYRGRLAPTPSGWLHHGHAATFQTAHQRARQAGGILVYRDEDIDPSRSRPEYAQGAIEDLRQIGLEWDEGPDVGGPHGPYRQSERIALYRSAMERLATAGVIYPSPHSRRAILELKPKHSPVDNAPLFPTQLRPPPVHYHLPLDLNVPWRFRVPEDRLIEFSDGRCGSQRFSTGIDFSDFLVWRREGVPAYELAVVVDDHAMGITEVVRGQDLLLSTARQLLIYEALKWQTPLWYHCPLVIDPETGQRLSKSNRSLPLQTSRVHPAP